MHSVDPTTEQMIRAVLAYAENRLRLDPVPLDGINRDPALMKEIIDYPYITFGVSDGGAHTKFLTAGRYPTEGIATFVRERGWLTLEEIHWRLSALPAASIDRRPATSLIGARSGSPPWSSVTVS